MSAFHAANPGATRPGENHGQQLRFHQRAAEWSPQTASHPHGHRATYNPSCSPTKQHQESVPIDAQSIHEGEEEMDPAEGRRILVAVDEGDESVHALRWCLTNFATRGDGELAPPGHQRPAPRPAHAAHLLRARRLRYVRFLSSRSDPTLIPASGTNRPAP
ncbi:hypothetical protein VPH35_073331 [Triticum aestivum]